MIEFEKHTITAKSKKLKANWSVEYSKPIYDPGIKKMLDKMVSEELLREIKLSYKTWKKTNDTEDKGFAHFAKHTWPTLKTLKEL